MKFKQIIKKWQKELYKCGWNSLFWNNHDLPRIVSRWGNDKEYRVESAKMLATLLHGLQGTPYVYQGEELGMTNVKFDIEDYKDIETLNLYKERLEKGYAKEDIMESIYVKGRDNARTPMQWDDTENAGFTTGTPWIKVNPNYKTINAKSQTSNKNSIFTYYKNLIAFRKEYPVFVDGDFEMLLEENEHLFAYKRTTEDAKLYVFCNFYGETETCDMLEEMQDKKLLISNYAEQEDNILKPYEARMYIEL